MRGFLSLTPLRCRLLSTLVIVLGTPIYCELGSGSGSEWAISIRYCGPQTGPGEGYNNNMGLYGLMDPDQSRTRSARLRIGPPPSHRSSASPFRNRVAATHAVAASEKRERERETLLGSSGIEMDGVEREPEESSSQRRERLLALRSAASASPAGAPPPAPAGGLLPDPELPGDQASCPRTPQRFDYYTNPAAAFSSSYSGGAANPTWSHKRKSPPACYDPRPAPPPPAYGPYPAQAAVSLLPIMLD